MTEWDMTGDGGSRNGRSQNGGSGIAVRPVAELTDGAEPAWPELRTVLADGPAPVEILPIEPAAGADCLYRLQVTTRSYLGALARHTGGVLVDHGWVRVLGGGRADLGLPSLADANGLAGDPARTAAPPAAMLVGFDVLGGQFSLNGPDPAALGRPGEPGQMCYFAPDTLEWESMSIGGHGAWLHWLVSGRLDRFYEGFRWAGWQDDVRDLALDQGMSIYPFPSTSEAQDDIDGTSRRPASINELFSLYGGDRLRTG